MYKFHNLTHLDEKWPLALDFDQKVKVWLFSVQSNFDQLTEKFICQCHAFEIFWTCWIGQDDAIESLSLWLILICHWLDQKSEIAFVQSKPWKWPFCPFGDLIKFIKEWWSNLDQLTFISLKWWYGSKIMKFNCKLSTIDFFPNTIDFRSTDQLT